MSCSSKSLLSFAAGNEGMPGRGFRFISWQERMVIFSGLFSVPWRIMINDAGVICVAR